MEGYSTDRGVPASGPYRATKLWNDVILAFRRGMPSARHRRYMKTYESCFSANESIDWLHQYLRANPNFGSDVTRFQTLQLFRKLHRARVIEDVRGGKHNKHDPTDNGRLFRFTLMSPVKNRVPFSERKDLVNTDCHRETNPVKPVECRGTFPPSYVPALPKEQGISCPSKPPLPNLKHAEEKPVSHPNQPVPYCQLVAKQLSASDIHDTWKHMTLDRLQSVLNLDNLSEILDSSFVLGKNIMHNCTYLNKSGIVTNIDPKDQLPHWAMSAMRCLARWPERTDENLPTYQGFERDVYRVVKDYFCGMSEPLMTYEMYEVVTNVFVTAEGTCYEQCSEDEDDTNPECLTSFESVENLMLDLTNVGEPGKCYNRSTPEAHVHMSRLVSRSTLDLSPIQAVQDSFQSGRLRRCESTANIPVAKYETAFGPENRTITRVYYKDGVSTDFGYSNGPDELSKTPLETHFEMSDSFNNLLPMAEKCQSTYNINFAQVKSTRARRKSSCELISKSRENTSDRRKSFACSIESPVSNDSGRCQSLSSGNMSANELSNYSDRYEPKVRKGNVPTRSPPHYSSLFPNGHQPVLDGATKLLRKCHRSKSNISLHRIKSSSSMNSSCNDPDNLPSEAAYPEQFHPHRAQSKESLIGRSLSLSDLMHAEIHKGQKSLKRTRSSTGSLSADIKERKKLALQTVCLLLPPANRRKLQLLIKLMSKMVENPKLQLDDNKSTRALLMETFYRSVLCSQDEADMEDLLVMKIISFLVDNCAEIMAVPAGLKDAVEQRLAIDSKNKFQKTYPDIYAHRFPNGESEMDIFPQKPKIKQPLLIAGTHIGIYEGYYKQADPNGTGSIGALDAASFLKKSGLKDTVLSQIWDLSDPTGKGYLEKVGFFSAIKFVSMAQNNSELNTSNLTADIPAPNLGPVEEVMSESPSHSAAGTGQWALSASEKTKYDQVFDSLQPVNSLLSGEKVRPVLMNSKLPVDILGRIWDMSDIDKDGYLDREEFAVAMHLVYRCLEKEPLPATLPPLVIPPSKRKGGVVTAGIPASVPGAVPGGIQAGMVMGGVPVLTPNVTGRSTPTQRSDSPSLTVPWVVTAAEKTNYDVMFKKADVDMDGLVSGQEIREVFLQSGVQNNILAHIWGLCDTKGAGKLNQEQFALAMYLIQKKLKGIDPPAQLSPEMVPPSMRPKQGADPTAFGVTDGTNAGPYGHVADFSAIKELDVISKDIDDMKREKLQIERDNAQKEADIKICNGEVQMLQKELDAITATLQQLESQKKEAQKRLDELDDKKSNLESNMKEMREKLEEEEKQVNSLKSQITTQEKSAMNQEEDLSKLRVDLNNLREEETRLEQQVDAGKLQLDLLVKSKKDLTLQVNQTRTRVQHQEDQKRLMKQSLGNYGSQINGDLTTALSGIQMDDQMSSRATVGSPASSIGSFSTGSAMEDFKDDPFKSKDPFGGGSGSESTQPDPFQSEDPFKGNDPFKSDGFSSDPFASDDPFKNAFSGSSAPTSSAKDDPFSSMDPFGSAFSSTSSPSSKFTTDNLDPFGGGGGSSSAKPSSSKIGNVFGSDPFAPNPTGGRTQSPSPALPPKQKKQPPPRPAPPKGRSPCPSPSKPPANSLGGFSSDPFAGSDPFASSTTTSGDDPFANFADFSPSKFEDDKAAWG
ncbi:uncharacterized protein LOC132562884 [Ylistrum balloti]|uniref:uncharacterized protein LOC132562884 n=1 Tax=Ylistrum balloti TaxID=509963 RepID=UPI0029058F1C|nr:uncharacterized protein LOC132562884 [Ylistrum balloti]